MGAIPPSDQGPPGSAGEQGPGETPENLPPFSSPHGRGGLDRHRHPPGREGHGSGSAHPAPQPSPALKRTVVRPAGSAPDPVDAAYVTNRLTTLTHELANLLDGSLRVIGLAKRSVEGAREHCPDQLERQLETVDAAMRQMAELVRSTMVGMAEGGIAGVREGFGSSSSLADAVRHAVDVMTPLGEEWRVRIDADVAPELGGVPAGPIYAVITNGVRNAIESIQRLGNGGAGDKTIGGRVQVRAWTEAGRTGRCVMITIEDDGQGPPVENGARGRHSAAAKNDGVFRLGYTTKPGGSGIGLSLSRDVVEQLGGTIHLEPRAGAGGTKRAGAVLRVCYPVPGRMAG